MTGAAQNFALPPALEPDLDAVHAYWNGLKRGENAIPFWDDVKFSGSPRPRETALIGALGKPLRFRFDILGEEIAERYGKAITGKFSDEVEPRAPLDEFTAQCLATVERRGPTYYRHRSTDTPQQKDGYARLILPLWGNGRIEMLLAAIAPTRSTKT